jgi:hypothetical protein
MGLGSAHLMVADDQRPATLDGRPPLCSLSATISLAGYR